MGKHDIQVDADWEGTVYVECKTCSAANPQKPAMLLTTDDTQDFALPYDLIVAKVEEHKKGHDG